MLTAEQRERELNMMRNPNEWPIWPILPLKKRGGPVGFLREEGMTNEPIRPIVYVGSMFQPLNATPKEYADFDAILDDGWVVD